ncbi:MarR family transcriptional regulator [Rothia sp. AR01]|uniref:MarR family transcriptional regulator n=1 Tax=Rothia santali TaxID=2949643 RepID=A0A9X2HBS2_9MICC|nr:MarR family transcriptional regulator [Rothia santali]MCP3425195.1 MarR family transcriptional regulator [Rothia santali]
MDTEMMQQARGRIEALTIAISVRSVPLIIGPLLETNLTIKQLQVLTTLATVETMSSSDLARAFSVSPATISRIVDKLENRDLIRKVESEKDHRVRQICLTNLGRDVVGKLLAARPELGEEILSRLSLTELNALEVGLSAINRELHHRP